MQMWPSDLHTCLACIIPTVEWHSQSCSYALDCTLWLCRIRHRYLSQPTCIRDPPPSLKRELETEANAQDTCGALLWEMFWRPARMQFTLSDAQETHRQLFFFRSTVIWKQAHSFPVCLTLFLKSIRRRPWWLRGLRAFRAGLDSGLRWIIARMWCMLSILICQGGLGNVLTDEWAGRGRAAAGCPVGLSPPVGTYELHGDR